MSTAVTANGKRARLNRAARREQLLDVAAQVFTTRGYHSSGMDEIADRAGVSKPVLYQHFPGKLELYLAVLEHYVAELTNSVRAALSSTTSNRLRVAAAIAAYFDFVDHDLAGYRLVFESDALGEPLVRARVEHATDASIDAIYQLITDDSLVTAFHARTVAVGLVGISQFAARQWLQADRPVDKQTAVNHAVALAWGGLSQVPRKR